MSAASPATTAMADATHAATQFGRRLYPENVVCNDDEPVSEAVRRALDDGDEKWPADFALGHTHLVMLATGRVEPVPPDRRRAAVDALIRVLAPTQAACDRCRHDVAPVAGLLPVGAGAAVAVLSLCSYCSTYLARDAFPSAYLLTMEN